MTGISRVNSSSLSSRQTWYPFILGISMSRMMRSGSSVYALLIASRPSHATLTEKPASSRMALVILTTSLLSSASRILPSDTATSVRPRARGL